MADRPTTPTASPVRGAWVAEVTGLLDLSRWPTGMRVIVRRERPHPGAQLRLTDLDGHRLTAFATNTAPAAPAANSPTSNSATAAGPAPRTASAPPKTPACATCRCTTSTRTGSGAPSSRSPASSPPGRRCSPCTDTQPAGGNPNGSDYGCSPSPAGLARTGRRTVCTCPPTHPGPRSPPSHHHGCARSPHPADPTHRPDTHPTGPWNRRPPERPRPNCHTHPAQSPPAARLTAGVDHQRAAPERSGLVGVGRLAPNEPVRGRVTVLGTDSLPVGWCALKAFA